MTNLIIGASGFVGACLYKLLRDKNTFGADIKRIEDDLIQLDMTSRAEIESHFNELKPRTVYLPAFIPGVDYCESNDEVNRLNFLGVKNVVDFCKKFYSKLVFFSTDYVFDGKFGPYLETDQPNPINKYGITKLQCEEIVKKLPQALIIRTTVVYGFDINSLNFLMTFTKDLINGVERQVPDDQIGSPTYVEDLAQITIDLAEKNKVGIYNVAGPDLCSRYVFALKIARTFGLNEELIKPVSTEDLHQVAKRPLRAGLIIDKIRTEINANPSGINKRLKKLKEYLIK